MAYFVAVPETFEALDSSGWEETFPSILLEKNSPRLLTDGTKTSPEAEVR